MKILTLFTLFAAAAFTSDQAKPPTESEVLAAKLKASEQETRLARLEGLILREQIATQQLDKVRADQQALFAETCVAAGIAANPKVCLIDLNARTVTRRTDPGATK